MTAPSPASSRPPLLIAGIGNIFLGDDAFGVEVVRRLNPRSLPMAPQTVQIVDFGIRGLDLAYALLEPYQAAILVDAAPRGGKPGNLYVLEPDLPPPPATDNGAAGLDAHSMDPLAVLRFAQSLGRICPRIVILGCEPSAVPDEMSMGLSPPVEATIAGALELLKTLANNLLTGSRDDLPAAMHAATCACQ